MFGSADPGNAPGSGSPRVSRRPGTGVRGRPADPHPVVALVEARCVRSARIVSRSAPRWRASSDRGAAHGRCRRRIDEQAHRGVPAPTKPAICPSVPVVIHTSPAAMYSGVSGNRDQDHRRPGDELHEYLTEFHETRSAERRKPALHRRRCSRPKLVGERGVPNRSQPRRRSGRRKAS
jgi:hypothetical protein